MRSHYLDHYIIVLTGLLLFEFGALQARNKQQEPFSTQIIQTYNGIYRLNKTSFKETDNKIAVSIMMVNPYREYAGGKSYCTDRYCDEKNNMIPFSTTTVKSYRDYVGGKQMYHPFENPENLVFHAEAPKLYTGFDQHIIPSAPMMKSIDFPAEPGNVPVPDSTIALILFVSLYAVVHRHRIKKRFIHK